MRNTMGASDGEIQSIKDLCSAQQQLGIIGDEVQLAGAQELATYLELSSSLKTIIPVMNDMAAQQYGLGATAENVTQIATMLGKVMNGQTEALSRYGYKFDEAQKYILQFGDESERAAVLADVVSESVGGMNASLAQTDVGSFAQIRNALGDIQEEIGKVVQGMMPVISVFADLAFATMGVIKLVQAIKGLSATTLAASVSARALAVAEKLQAAAAKILGVSTLAAKTATGALKAEIIATEAALTLGLTLAVSALVEVFSRLVSRSGEAADSIEDVSSAEKAYKQASSEAMAEIAEQIVTLEDLIKKKANEGEAVEKLNKKYGEIFGTYSNAADWYDVLTSKSAEYCKQLGYEAMAASYRDELVEALKRQADAEEEINRLKKEGQAYKTQLQGNGLRAGTVQKVQVPTEALEAAEEARQVAEEAVKAVTEKMQDASSKAAEISENIKKGAEEAGKSWKEMSLSDLTKAIQLQEERVKSYIGTVETAAAKEENAVLKAMKARKAALEKQYGLSDKADKDTYNGDKLIENAKSYNEIGNNIKFYQKQLEDLDITKKDEIAAIAATIEQLKKEQQAVLDIQNAAAAPAQLNTLEDIDKAIKAQQELRTKASVKEIAGIDAEIKRLEALRSAFEGATIPKNPRTLAEFDAAINYQQDLLKNATSEERVEIEKVINRLTALKTAFEQSSHVIRNISEINTFEDLDREISYYTDLVKTQSAEEIESTQRTIDALEKKKTVLEKLRDIPAMQRQISSLDGLSGKQLKLELNLIGFDELRSKVRELKQLLNDAGDSWTDEQKNQVRSLITSYEGYCKVLAKSNVSVVDGWANVRGIGNSIKSLTSALEEDGTAWDKLCTIVDSLIGIYEGVEGIVKIIKTITGVTDALTVAKAGEAAATKLSAATAVTGAGEEVIASGAVTTAREIETQANMKAAASAALAAHSWMPYVGIALGVAAIGAMIAAMSSLPKFANGGLVYGPTLGLVGEYSGASSNPEVIAPLSKLRDELGGNGIGGDVEFHISGRDLYGVLKRQQNYLNR